MKQATESRTTVLNADQRAQVAAELQAELLELIDLTLQGKQVHWNLVGPYFRPLHLQFDEMVNEYRAWTDLVAERLVAIGVWPKGQAGTVAKESRLPALPEGAIDDRRAVALFTERLTAAASAARERMDRLEGADLASQDILIDVVRGLEKQLWMLEVQRT